MCTICAGTKGSQDEKCSVCMELESLPKESFFAKIETDRKEVFYSFVEFEPHPPAPQTDFPFCKLTLFSSEGKSGVYFRTPEVLSAKQCLNQNLEWKYPYFKRIRHCFKKRLADVIFSFSADPTSSSAQLQILFNVVERQGSGKVQIKVCGAKILLKQERAESLIDVIAGIAIEHSSHMLKSVREQEIELENLKTDRQQSSHYLEQTTKSCEERERNILEQFRKRLNKYKRKIFEAREIIKINKMNQIKSESDQNTEKTEDMKI